MADSVALLFATNLATIGGHVAEMISIFVYPVIGYFWTRRRRRSPSVDFNIAEEPTRSMMFVEDMTDPIESLAKCIASLVLVLQTLESLMADEALPRVSRGRERVNKLMDEHRSIQGGISTLTEKLSDMSTGPGDPLTLQATIRMSRRIRLLHLKSEMLSVEIRQSRLVYKDNDDAAANPIDLERGCQNILPTAQKSSNTASGEPDTLLIVRKDSPSSTESCPATTTDIHSCSSFSQWLPGLSPVREQVLEELALSVMSQSLVDTGRCAERCDIETNGLETGQASLPKHLSSFGNKRRTKAHLPWIPPESS
uniref:Uncharacterized protein n=1 Tax=Moniliophthora roreri TaxID=221103 RepID=A0A0W0FK64_MONRR